MTTTPSLWSPKRASTRPKWRFWPSASCRTPDLLKGKVDMLPNGAIVVDDYMQASAPGVYAAGDSAPCLQPHRPARLHSAGHQRGAPGLLVAAHRDADREVHGHAGHVRRAAVRSLARRLRPDPRRCRTPRAHGPRDLAHRGLSPGLHAHHHPSHVDSDPGTRKPARSRAASSVPRPISPARQT